MKCKFTHATIGIAYSFLDFQHPREVLLDFKEAIVYHTSGEFPVKINFFSHGERYEILYIGLEQEILISHVMESIPANDAQRLVVLESQSQASKISIEGVAAYCLVDDSGTVSYYQRK